MMARLSFDWYSDSVHIYYLDNDDKPVFAKCWNLAKGGYLSTMKFYKDAF